MTMFTKAALARRVLAGLLATVATGAITATAVAEPPSVPTVSGLARFRSYPLIDRAYDALRRGDTARAVSLLEEALRVVPGDADVLVQVLTLYTRLERPEQVVVLATKHLAQDGGNAQVRAYRGFAQRKLGKDREALDDFLAVGMSPTLRPDQALAVHEALLDTATSLGDFELVLRLTAESAPTRFKAAVRRADALGRLGRPLEAAATFADAARLAEHPDERGAMLLAQAQQLIAGRDFEQARAVLRQVAEAGDGRSDDAAAVARNLVGAEVAQGGRPEAVEADVAAYLSAYGPDGRMLLQRALARLQAGRHADAVADLRAAARDDRLSDPERHLLREALLDQAVALGDNELALATLGPGPDPVYRDATRRAVVLARLHHPAEAGAAYAQAAKLASSMTERLWAARGMADSAARLGDLAARREGLLAALQALEADAPRASETRTIALPVLLRPAAPQVPGAILAQLDPLPQAGGAPPRPAPFRSLEPAARAGAAPGAMLTPLPQAAAPLSQADGGDSLPGRRRSLLQEVLDIGAATAHAATMPVPSAQPGSLPQATSLPQAEAAARPSAPPRSPDSAAMKVGAAGAQAMAVAVVPAPADGGDILPAELRAREPVPGSPVFEADKAAIGSLQQTLRRELSVLEERRGDLAAAVHWLRAVPEAAWARADRERLAELLHREGEPAEAVKALDGIAPRDGVLRLRRATWLHEAGQDEQAMAELAPMLDAGTPPAERFAAARQTGVYAHAAGDLQREQEALAIAHALRPDDGELVLTAADNALSRGDLAAADGLLAGIDVRAGADTVRKARTRRAEVALRRGDRPRAVTLQREVVASLAPADQDRPKQLLRLGRMEADAGDCAAAVATLAEVPPAGLPAHDRVGRGICLTRLQQWDDAAEELALALRAPPAELEQSTRLLALDTLADTHEARGRFAQAASVRLEADGIAPSAARAVRRAHDLRLASDQAGAIQALARVDAAALAGEDLAFYQEEVALAAPDAARALAAREAAAKAAPTAARWVTVAEAQRADGDLSGAHQAYREALALDPDNETALLGVGYLFYSQRRFAESIRPFTAAHGPRSSAPAVRADIAYNHLALGQKKEGLRELERAIDGYRVAAASQPKAAAQPDPATEEKIFDLRREHMFQSDRFSGDTALTIQPGVGAEPRFADAQRASGSQFGAELFWAPPLPGKGSGEGNASRFQLSTRLFAALDDDTLAPKWDSAQLAAGVRYRPLEKQNLVLSFERLIGLGEDARDGWLPRAMWSWQDGGDIEPFKQHWNYTSLFADVSYVWASSSSWQALGQVVQGRAFKLTDRTALIPHVVAVGRGAWGSEQKDEEALELGGGVSLAHWFAEDQHNAPSQRLQLDLEYRYVTGRTDDGSSVLLRLGWTF
jgi:tetratricopeptide (TPR) repeat protein